jgi:single-stranded-DNA-specific exonuclease
MQWILPTPADAASCAALTAELGLAPFFASLLCRRGITTPAEAQRFLQPRLKTLSDPFLLPNMRAAIGRILEAIDRRERVALYGDYDVDGVTSLALFTRILRACGLEPARFLPGRAEEGYGLSRGGIRRCVAECQPQLLIAVDCGTSSAAEVAELTALGVDVIVFDHHHCTNALPVCTAVVNPRLGDDFHYLCSAGIVFKACHALLKERPLPDFDLRAHLDLVALGTVADVVPLKGENRVLVQRGLRVMETTGSAGLQALIEVAQIRPPFRPVDIGFRLGPRLNAAGRLGTAQAALELLLCDDPARARELAAGLDARNRERQSVENEIAAAAEELRLVESDSARDAAIVLGGDGWHQGVTGIVAARIARRHHRPALIVSFDAEGVGKGSGRSIEGLPLVQALDCCAEFLEKWGGHDMAAGFTVRRERFEDFRRAFLACARERLSDEALTPRLHLDGEVTLRDLTFDLLSLHESIQPFGTGNPQPLFLARGVSPAGAPRVVKEKHLRIELAQEGRTHAGIYFNGASQSVPAAPWDVAFQLERHEYEGRQSIQMEIKAIRAFQPPV